MAPLIRGVLSNLIGEDDAKTIDIISNEVDIKSDGSWSIKFRHPERWVIVCLRKVMRRLSKPNISGFGHDKSQAILPYRALAHRTTLFFFGDGVSGSYVEPEQK